MRASLSKKVLVGLLTVLVLGLFVAITGLELGQSQGNGNTAGEAEGTSVVHGDGVILRLPSLKENELDSIFIRRAEEKPWGSLKAFHFSPAGIEFGSPAELTVDTSDLGLPPGTDPGSLRLAYLENRRWRPLESSRYDVEEDALKAEIEHFSTYGIVPEPGEINEVGTLFELNGISILASEEVYLRLTVTPEFVRASLSAKPGRLVDLTFSGLPTTVTKSCCLQRKPPDLVRIWRRYQANVCYSIYDFRELAIQRTANAYIACYY